MEIARRLELAQFREPTEAEALLMRAAFLADPDAWRYPRITNSLTRRLKSIDAGFRWVSEPPIAAPATSAALTLRERIRAWFGRRAFA